MNESWEDKMLFALNGAFRELRDNNFVHPDEILVYHVKENTIETVSLLDLPLQYPAGEGHRWSYEDLGRVVTDKVLLYRQSIVANEIADEDPSAQPACGTVVLVVTDHYRPYKRLVIKANASPWKA